MNFHVVKEFNNENGLLARLVPLFEPKKGVFKKATPTCVFGKLKTQLFYKSCVLNFYNLLRTKRGRFMDPQGSINQNALCAFTILPLQ